MTRKWFLCSSFLFLTPLALSAAQSFTLFSPIPANHCAERTYACGDTEFSGFGFPRQRVADFELPDSVLSGAWTPTVASDSSIRLVDGDKPARTPRTIEPKRAWAWAISTGVIVGGIANSFTDGPNQRFHFTNKNGFGSNRFAGGADLVSHFVDIGLLTKELMIWYSKLGYSTERARILGAAISTMTSFMIEVGDGRGDYGFNYEDIVAGALGTATAILVNVEHADDLVGFRVGYLPPPAVKPCCHGVGMGRTYTNELYTGDLKLLGLGRRLGFQPGVARYLLVSVTYGTKGYPDGHVPDRERQVGVEVGVNFGQIARDLGLREDSWAGIAAYALLDSFRIPYTQIGYRYDMNHRRWHGPDIGNSYGWR